jgi:hypothetical protein
MDKAGAKPIATSASDGFCSAQPILQGYYREKELESSECI